MKQLSLLAALLTLAACGGQTQAPKPEAPTAETPSAATSATSDALTPAGWGPLRLGMTKAEVVVAVGDRADPNSSGGPQPEVCDEFHPARAPDGLYIMLEDGKLSRITITELSQLKTGDGFGLGAEPAAVKTFYGARAKSEPHQYQDKPAEYITVWDVAPGASDPFDPKARGLLYEVDGTGKVGAIHAGGASIQYAEGCL